MPRAIESHTTRRAILQGLATLPLTGGTARPAAALPGAGPADPRVLAAYSEWLHFERKLLFLEEWPELPPESEHVAWVNTGVTEFHFPNWPERWQDRPQPSTRAALVLSAVGIDLQPILGRGR